MGDVTNSPLRKGKYTFLICFHVIFKEQTVSEIAHFVDGGFWHNGQITLFFNFCFDGSLNYCWMYQL